MDILNDIFSTIKKQFYGDQDDSLCYGCGVISAIWTGLNRFQEQIYRFIRRKYLMHISHSCLRIFEGYCASIVGCVVQVWPDVFFFVGVVFVSVVNYMKWKYRGNKSKFVRGKRGALRRGKLELENDRKFMLITEGLNKTDYCTMEGNTDNFEYYLKMSGSYCSNNFALGTHSEENPKVIFRDSHHSLSSKFSANISRQGSCCTVGDPGDFGEMDVLNEPIPVSRMRRESVCAEACDPEKDSILHRIESHHKTQQQIDFLYSGVVSVFPFNLLDNDQLTLVLDAMFEKRVSKGEVIICEGDDGDFFYVIERGSYIVSVSKDGEEKVLKVYHDRGSFGELALLYNTRRAATVRAAVDGVVWCLDRLTFKGVVAQTAHQRRIMNESLLRQLPLLKYLPTDDILSLSDALVRRVFDDGELIIKQGAVADGMYFVRKGNAYVCMEDEFGEEKELVVLTVGDYFGERALITKGRREASVYARGFVECEFLDLSAYERLLGPCVDFFKEKIAMQNQEMLVAGGGTRN